MGGILREGAVGGREGFSGNDRGIVVAGEGDPLVGNLMVAVEARGGGFELHAEFVHAIGDVAAEHDAAEGVFSESIAHVEDGDKSFIDFEHAAGEESDAASGEVAGVTGELGMSDLSDEDEIDRSGVGAAFPLAEAAFGVSFSGFEECHETSRDVGISLFVIGAAHGLYSHGGVCCYRFSTIRSGGPHLAGRSRQGKYRQPT